MSHIPAFKGKGGHLLEGGAYLKGALIKFLRSERGRLIEGGAYLRGDAN